MSLDTDATPLMELNRELMALRRAQLILQSSPTASMRDKRRIAERVMELVQTYGLLPETDDPTESGVMF